MVNNIIKFINKDQEIIILQTKIKQLEEELKSSYVISGLALSNLNSDQVQMVLMRFRELL